MLVEIWMEYIRKLPFILSAAVTIIVGFLSYRSCRDNETVYARMAICLISVYAIGTYFRSALLKIADEASKIKKEKEMKAKTGEKNQTGGNNDPGGKDGAKEATRIDLRAGEPGEDFTPLKVSEIIRTKTKDT